MTDIPDITSPAVAVYLHQFVEWDIDKARYVSAFDKELTKSKQNEASDIIQLGASLTELDFLISVEEDPQAKKLLEKAMNVWKKKYDY